MKSFLTAFSMLFLLTACSQPGVPLSDPSENPDQVTVTNFEECVQETGTVMESYPRQCRFEDMVFIEEIDQIQPADDVEGPGMMAFLESALQERLETEQAIDIQVDQLADEHVRGMFQVEGDQAGAIFLAAWDQGEWVVVYAGNGVINCDVLEPYNFPENMMEDCEA